MNNVQFVTTAELDRLSSEAKQAGRLRKNFNFHDSDEDRCHRLLNAIEPDSYIQPHRHGDGNKDEALVAIRGKMGLIIFDDDGSIEEAVLLTPQGDVTMVNIPHLTFHTLISLEEGSIFFEAKGGPFRPLTDEEKAPWAPEEGQAAVGTYLASLRRLFHPGRAAPRTK